MDLNANVDSLPKVNKRRRLYVNLVTLAVVGISLVVGMLHFSGTIPIDRMPRALRRAMNADQPPDTDHPAKYERSRFSFSYPGNWEIDSGHPDFDPDRLLVVDSPKHAKIHIEIFSEPLDTQEVINYAANRLTSGTMKIDSQTDFQSWGKYTGRGQHLKMRSVKHSRDARLFVYSNANGGFLVWEHGWVPAPADNSRGFKLVESSFALVE